jgi:hypothetical protein
MRNSRFVIALLGLGTLTACGSANTPAVGSGTGAGTAAEADAGASAIPGEATDAGTGVHPTPPIPGADAGPTITNDAGATEPTFGIGGTTSALFCGTELYGVTLYTCAIPGELCCYQGGASPGFSCGATCPIVLPGKHPGSAALACESAANCGTGLSCCVHLENGQTVSRCEASCAGAPAQLCDFYAAPGVDTGCPATAPCSHAFVNEFGLPPTYATCGGVRN